MGDLILTTFDWVPEMPRGYVRDLRVRWALEEAGLPYRVESTPFRRNLTTANHSRPFTPTCYNSRGNSLCARTTDAPEGRHSWVPA